MSWQRLGGRRRLGNDGLLGAVPLWPAPYLAAPPPPPSPKYAHNPTPTQPQFVQLCVQGQLADSAGRRQVHYMQVRAGLMAVGLAATA